MFGVLNNKAWEKIKKSNSIEFCLITLDAFKNLGFISDNERSMYLEDLLRGNYER